MCVFHILWPTQAHCAISGSYPMILTQEEAAVYNNVLLTMGFTNRSNLSEFDSKSYKSLMHTIPFQFLVDTIGHRIEQSIISVHPIDVDDQEPPTLITFYHQKHLTCFKPQFSPEQRDEISSINQGIQIYIYTDPHSLKFPKPKHPVGPIIHSNLNIHPYDWDMVVGATLEKIVAYRLYVVPRDAYPDSLETNLLLQPGYFHSIKLKMTESVKGAGLEDTCITQPQNVGYLNPYNPTNSSYDYPMMYSYSSCTHRENAAVYKTLAGCQNSILPLTTEFRDLASCLKYPDVIASNYTFKVASVEFKNLKDKTGDDCQLKHPCVEKKYTADISSGKWPSDATAGRIVRLLLTSLAERRKLLNQSVPGLDFLVKLAEAVHNGFLVLPNETLQSQDQFLQEFTSEATMKLSIETGEYKSTKIIQVVSFTFEDFVASAGGILGLYIGCSLLTLFEVLEFIHDVIIGLKNIKGQPTVTDGSVEKDVMKSIEAQIRPKESITVAMGLPKGSNYELKTKAFQLTCETQK